MTERQSTRLAFERVSDGARTRLVRYDRTVPYLTGSFPRAKRGLLDRYLVGSASDVDTDYLVMVVRLPGEPDEYLCGCPRRHHYACWHRAAVATVRANRRAHGLTPEGPSAEQLRVAEPQSPAPTPEPYNAAAKAARLAEISAMFSR